MGSDNSFTPISPWDLLRELLEKDRAAIEEVREIMDPSYAPEGLLDFHRRIEQCLEETEPFELMFKVQFNKGMQIIEHVENGKVFIDESSDIWKTPVYTCSQCCQDTDSLVLLSGGKCSKCVGRNRNPRHYGFLA